MIPCSRRLPWDTPENRLARLHDELRAAGPVLDLTCSNPTEVGLPYPAEALAAALADPGAARYQPTPQGLPRARAAIAARYAARGRSIDPQHLVVTASTSEAYSLVFKLLCDPGDAVLGPQPSYPLFDHLAALEGVRLVPYRLGFDGHFFLDRQALERALDAAGERARAVLLVSPANPTGQHLQRDERRALVGLCAERQLPIVCDEVFSDFAFAPDPARAGSLVDEEEAVCLVLDGISKSLGLPQLKLGWIHVGGPLAERARLLPRLHLCADTYLSVGTPVQLALPALFELGAGIAAAIRQRCARNLAALTAATAGTACGPLPLEAGWSACLRLPAVRSDEEWALLLGQEARVVVLPGYFFDLPESLCALVVSLLVEPATFDQAVAAIVARVAAT